MPRIGELTIEINVSLSKLRANLATASSLIRDWSLLATGLSAGITSAFKQISAIGIRAVQVGLAAVVGSFLLAAKSGADFEDAMVRAFTVLKEGTSATSGSLGELTDKARLLGRETLFSATDAARGMEILAKAGFDTKEILDSIRPSLNLAIVGNLELSEAAGYAVAALRGFNLETSEAKRVSDVLALAASQANMTVADLGSALSFVAPVAKGAGLSIEQTAATIGVLSNAGIRGSRAGTSLRRAIAQMLAPSGRAQKVMAQLGVTFTDAAGNVKPMVTVIRELNAAGATAADTMTLFGLRAGPSMLALMRTGAAGISQLEGKLNDASGAADRMAQNFRTTVKGRIRDLVASVVDLGLAFSEEFKKPLADTIFSLRNFIVDIVNTGNKMGTFKAIVKGVINLLEPLANIVEDLKDRFIAWLSALTPADILNYFDNLKMKLQSIIDSATDGTINASFERLRGDVSAIASGLGTIGEILKVAWSGIPDPLKPMIVSGTILTGIFLKLFGGLTNIVILFISLNALAASLGVKIAFGAGILITFKAIGMAILVLFKAILAVVIALAAILATVSMVRFIAELETIKAMGTLIKATWSEIVANINVAIKGMGALFNRRNVGAQVAFQESKQELRARRDETNRAYKDLKEAEGRDNQKLKDFNLKDEMSRTLSDLGNMLPEKLQGIFDKLTPEQPIVPPVSKTGGMLDGIDISKALQDDKQLETLLQDMGITMGSIKTVEEVDLMNIKDSFDRGIDILLENQRSLAEGYRQIAEKMDSIERQAIKPADDAMQSKGQSLKMD